MGYSNYAGWLVKIGDYTIPKSIIKAESFKSQAIMQDLDDYTDADGFLHRNAVELKSLKVEFETVPMLDDEEFGEFMHNINENITNAIANECTVTAYVPRYNTYMSQTGYMVDLEPQMYFADDEKILYNAVRIAFVGGVYDGS